MLEAYTSRIFLWAEWRKNFLRSFLRVGRVALPLRSKEIENEKLCSPRYNPCLKPDFVTKTGHGNRSSFFPTKVEFHDARRGNAEHRGADAAYGTCAPSTHVCL